jgi:hypothetical protein
MIPLLNRRLEPEAGRNLEVMWLIGRLAPDHKTIGERKENGPKLETNSVGGYASRQD